MSIFAQIIFSLCFGCLESAASCEADRGQPVPHSQSLPKSNKGCQDPHLPLTENEKARNPKKQNRSRPSCSDAEQVACSRSWRVH